MGLALRFVATLPIPVMNLPSQQHSTRLRCVTHMNPRDA